MDESTETKKKIRYCIRMWLLQEIAGCTFLEARVFLRRERNEIPEKLMEAYNLSDEEYSAIEQSAHDKVSKADSEGNLFRGYGPLYHGRKETVEW